MIRFPVYRLATVWLALTIAPPCVAADELSEPLITADDREHWSFQPLLRPQLPDVRSKDQVNNPLDRFIVARLESVGLSLQSEAERTTLIRRLSFDLTGLPPTPAAIDAFVADRSPDAYSRLVDRLLESPDYGPRWAQHWLDLARFSETDGFEHDQLRSSAWRYRDWVVDAMNLDMPYDRFVHLQLAGDEIEAGDEQAHIATAFCLSGPDMPDINSQEERRHNVLNELTSTVGEVFLGMQFGCAQCHDHKYDPLSQADFYRLRAIFEPAVRVKKNRPVDTLRESEPSHLVSHLMIRGDWRRPGPRVMPAFPRIANIASHPFVAEDIPGPSTGRRTALARWLTRPDHPLTARVIANRVWQYHFGRGLSATPSDFGLVGDSPSHPDLLDWLAAELIRRQWSLKQLHRTIVTSATYRQAGPIHKEDSPSLKTALRIDPGNLRYSRFPRRRLEGESLRDAMLVAAGVLNTKTGGPGIMPPLPDELLSTVRKGHWNQTTERAEHHRRSIYVFARRNLRFPIFEAFDRPDANASCARRDRSTTAVQSLLQLNAEFSLHIAQRLAGRCMTEDPRTSHQVEGAFRHLLGRCPSVKERTLADDFLLQQARLLNDEKRHRSQLAMPIPKPDDADMFAAAAFTDFCLAMLNCSEFLYVD